MSASVKIKLKKQKVTSKQKPVKMGKMCRLQIRKLEISSANLKIRVHHLKINFKTIFLFFGYLIFHDILSRTILLIIRRA